jgi:hypothetical protein
MHDVYKSYTVDNQVTIINSSNCNNPDRDKLNTQQHTNFNLYHVVGTHRPTHNEKRHLCDCTYPITPNQSIYNNVELSIQLSQQKEATTVCPLSFPITTLQSTRSNRDEPIIKATVNTTQPTYDSQQDTRQGVTGLVYQNRAL